MGLFFCPRFLKCYSSKIELFLSLCNTKHDDNVSYICDYPYLKAIPYEKDNSILRMHWRIYS